MSTNELDVVVTRHVAVPMRDGTLLRTSGSATVWKVVGGKRSAVTPDAGATIIDVGSTALAAIPLA